MHSSFSEKRKTRQSVGQMEKMEESKGLGLLCGNEKASRSRELAQWVRAPAAKPDKPSSIPSTHIGKRRKPALAHCPLNPTTLP